MNVSRDVTVICPTYNSAKFVAATLASITDQTVQPAAVLVCDDGSTDDTCGVVAESLTFFRCDARLLRLPHKGPGAARNAGVRAATTPWIAFLDSDDLWFSEKLERVGWHAAKQPEVDMLCHNEEQWRFDGTSRVIDFSQGIDVNRPILEQLYRRNCFTPSAIVCKRDPMISCGLFDETYLSGQDYELWMRLAPTVRFSYIREVLGVYMERPGSISLTAAKRRFYNTARLLWRHGGKVSYCTLASALQRLILKFPNQEFALRRRIRMLRALQSKNNRLEDVGLRSGRFPLRRKILAGLYRSSSIGNTLVNASRNEDVAGPRVLLFHNIASHEQSAFANLLAAIIAHGWEFIDASNFSAMLQGDAPIRRRTLLLTFDDGFRSNRIVAEEVLARFGIHAVFFVPSIFPALSAGSDRAAFIADRICDARISRDAVPSELQPMDALDLKWLIANGHTIGSHTATHARLSRIPSLSNLREEIVGSANRLQAITGSRIDLLAFPFGNVHSISLRALRQCVGVYGLVFSGIRGFNNRQTSPFAVRRDSFQPTDPAFYVCAVLDGAADRLHKKSAARLDEMASTVNNGTKWLR